jgi:TonB-dependent SusC/RagA subfamily outer membrane receptor
MFTSMKLVALVLLLMITSAVSALDGMAQSDTLSTRKSKNQTHAGTRQASSPLIMPGIQLDTAFSTLPAQNPAVNKAAPAWLRAKASGLPMYIIDGKPATASQLRAIRQMDIASLNVLDGGRATALYGKNARNGLVIITTKKAVHR